MRIRTLNRLHLAAAVLLVALALAALVRAERIEAAREHLLETSREARGLSTQLLEGSRFLTDSVRAFAATGEKQYLRAYDEEVAVTRRRDHAIEGIAKLGLPGRELALLDKAKLNSDVLIDLERRCFAARESGDQALAISLVFGEPYREALRTIHEPIRDFQARVSARLEAEAHALIAQVATTRRIAQASVLGAFGLLLLALLHNQGTLARGTAVLETVLRRAAHEPPARAEEAMARREDELGALARAVVERRAELAEAGRAQLAHRARAELALRVVGARDERELLQMLFSHLHGAIGLLRGLYHRAGAAGQPLHTLAAFGANQGASGTTIEWGAGLAGECARSGIAMALPLSANGPARVFSGTGDAAAGGLLLRPLMREGELLGVLELATLEAPTEETEARVAGLEPLLATNILLQRQREEAARLAAREHAAVTQAGSELARQVELLQSLLDGIPNPVFYKGADTRYLGCNRAYERAFAIEKAQFIGKRVLDLDYLPQADRVAYQQEDERVIAEGGYVRRIVRLAWAGRAECDNLYWVQGFRNTDGSPGGLVGTFIDITGLRESAAGDPT